LNLNKLRGVIWEHNPNYYAFSGANKLNQIIASRFSVTWLITSPRIKSVLEGEDKKIIWQELVKNSLQEKAK
jgi:hypothetical protein